MHSRSLKLKLIVDSFSFTYLFISYLTSNVITTTLLEGTADRTVRGVQPVLSLLLF